MRLMSGWSMQSRSPKPGVLRARAMREVGLGVSGLWEVESGAMDGVSPGDAAGSFGRKPFVRPAPMRLPPARFRRLLASRRLPRQAALGERRQVFCPDLVLPAAQLVEIGPGIDAGVVQIVELD